MDGARHITDELLLDHLLERCDRQEANRVAAALAADSDLAARFERLRTTLTPLDTWTTPPPPATMVSDILDAVAARDARAVASGPRAVRSAPPANEGGGGGRRIISLREVLALAACVAIFVGLFGPSMSAVRRSARRQMCANNLRQLGWASSAYASANRGYLPYAGPPTGPWLSQPGKQRAPNTRHMYLILRRRYVADPKVVICPESRDDQAMLAEDIDRYNDFPQAANRSYHLQWMGGPVRIEAVARPFVMPYTSDPNPMFEGERFNPEVDPETANSTTHRGRGQNVLFLDGRVGWYKRPVLVETGDNMWQIGNLRQYSGSEAPTAATDVFMAP